MDQSDPLNALNRLTCQGLCCFLGQCWRSLCARVVLPDRWSAWMVELKQHEGRSSRLGPDTIDVVLSEGLTYTQLPLACDSCNIYIMFPNMFPLQSLSEARLGAKHRNLLWGARLLFLFCSLRLFHIYHLLQIPEISRKMLIITCF